MTKEQWLIYLYGIYPEGGWNFFWALVTVIWFIFLIALYLEVDEEFTLCKISKKLKYRISIFLISMLLLCQLVPSKNTFLTIIATPKVIEILKESSEKGTIKRLENIFNKSLTNIEQKLDIKTKETHE